MSPRNSGGRLDPANWPERFQFVVLFGIVAGSSVAALAWRELAGAHWSIVPVAGALIWRFERRRWRDIASWTVPLAIALLVAHQLPPPLGLVASLLGLAVLTAMMFSSRARDGWLRLVAPGVYRVFSGSDRRVAEQLDILDVDTWRAYGRYVRKADSIDLGRRLERVAAEAEAIAIDDPEWQHVRNLFVAWARLGAEIAVDRGDIADEAFAELERRRQAFEAAKLAITDARSRPLR